MVQQWINLILHKDGWVDITAELYNAHARSLNVSEGKKEMNEWEKTIKNCHSKREKNILIISSLIIRILWTDGLSVCILLILLLSEYTYYVGLVL